MPFILAFLTCGIICLIAQVLMDLAKLTPPMLLNAFLAAGGVLTPCGFMAWLDSVGGGGSLVAICAAGNAFETAGEALVGGEPLMLVVILMLFVLTTLLGMVAGGLRHRLGQRDGANAPASVPELS